MSELDGDIGDATSQSSDVNHHQSPTDSSIPIPSIRDITSVDIDQMDGDSIEQLQLVLRRLQRRCDDNSDNDDDDDGGGGQHHDVTDQQMISGCEQLHKPAFGQLTVNISVLETSGWSVFTAQQLCSCSLPMSICLSVRLSVKRMDWDETKLCRHSYTI